MRQGEVGRGSIPVLALIIGAALCVGAGILIASFLGDSHPEQTIAELGYTTVALTIFGPCAIAGLFLVAQRPRWWPFGYLTAVIAVLGFVAIAVRLFEWDSLLYGGDFKLQGIGLILTLTLSQASLVLAYDRDDDPLPLRLITLASVVLILGLGVLGALEITVDSLRLADELFGVLFTLYLLGAALLVLFRLAAWGGRRAVASG